MSCQYCLDSLVTQLSKHFTRANLRVSATLHLSGTVCTLIILCDHNPMISHTGDKASSYSTMVTSYGRLHESNPASGKDWLQYIK